MRGVYVRSMTRQSAFDVLPTPEEVRRVAREARELPHEPVQRGPFLWLAGAVAIWAVTTAIVASRLPERVPTHWSGSTPDQWSSRVGAISMFIVVPLIMAGVIALVPHLVVRWPLGVNVPRKEEWLSSPHHLRRLERLLREDMALLSALIFVFFAILSVVTAAAAHRPGGELPTVLLVGPILLFVGGILGFIIGRLLSSRYTPPDDLTA